MKTRERECRQMVHVEGIHLFTYLLPHGYLLLNGMQVSADEYLGYQPQALSRDPFLIPACFYPASAPEGCGCTGSAERCWVLVLVFLGWGSGPDPLRHFVFPWLLCRPCQIQERTLDVRGGSSSPAIRYPIARQGQGISTEMNDVWVEANRHRWEEENRV